MLKDFREFALRGNVIDLAVGVIIGAAFGKIVASLVGDVVMPLVGTLLGGLDFSDLQVQIGEAKILYGKRRLREIDRRLRFLIKRLESAEIVRSAGRDTDQVFFGATVKVRKGQEVRELTIVGVDEVDPAHGRVSWVSPVAKALIKAREGDTVTLRSPAGEEQLEILEVSYR